MLDASGKPVSLTWHYSRAEVLADGLIHALGITLACAGLAILAAVSFSFAQASERVAVLTYGTSLLVALTISAAYNLWPVNGWKWYLRRIDHSTIFLLIAGTYTPFLLLSGDGTTRLLLAGIWAAAIGGALVKIMLPGRFERLGVAVCLGLGWSGLLTADQVLAALPAAALWLLVAGGLLYSVGVIFHLWQRLRFQNAIWHGFVLAAAGCHYGAVLLSVWA